MILFDVCWTATIGAVSRRRGVPVMRGAAYVGLLFVPIAAAFAMGWPRWQSMGLIHGELVVTQSVLLLAAYGLGRALARIPRSWLVTTGAAAWGVVVVACFGVFAHLWVVLDMRMAGALLASGAANVGAVAVVLYTSDRNIT